ncbi:MAG TPA: hypothetical protein VLB75_04160 [Steroidobacteraceae bacterium]|nr:hypothetical protein [Steroidobacteraceae bacterium]
MPDIEAQIRRALAEYLKDPTVAGLDAELTVLARGLGALPVHADMGGVLLIRPSGEVLVVHSNQEWTEHAECEVVTDPEWISHSYDACAERYPNLRAAMAELKAS